MPHTKAPFSLTTAFDGLVTEILDKGARSVRLANGHIVTALPSRALGAQGPRAGDKVTVELPFRELHGWRLVHTGQLRDLAVAA